MCVVYILKYVRENSENIQEDNLHWHFCEMNVIFVKLVCNL